MSLALLLLVALAKSGLSQNQNVDSDVVQPTACEESMLLFFNLDSECPSACDDGTGEAGKCANGEPSFSQKSCGTTACVDFMSSIDDDTYAEFSAGLATCTNGYQMYGDGGENEGEMIRVLSSRAYECGVELVLSLNPNLHYLCEEAMSIFSKLEIACPSALTEKIDDEELRYSPESCGTTTCADFMSSIDDGALAEFSAGLATCTNGYQVYGDGGEYEGYFRMSLIERSNGCGVELGVSSNPCEESVSILSKMYNECPSACDDEEGCEGNNCCAPGQSSHSPESCGTTACADFMSSIDDDAYVEFLVGLATCTNGYQMYGDGGENEGYMRMVLSGLAIECGVELGLSLNPCEESFSIFSKMDNACPSACDDEDECEGDNCCAPGQSSHSPESCGTTACADFMSSIDDDAYAEFSAGLATCTNGYQVYGDGGEYEGYFRMSVIDRTNGCGVESGLSKTPCDESILTISKMDNACPSACDDEDECEGDNCCAPGQSSYSPESCGTTACADFMSSIDDDAYAELSAGVATCKGGYEVYGDGGKQEGYIRTMLIESAKACGVESGFSSGGPSFLPPSLSSLTLTLALTLTLITTQS
jgi:hypothetical protein